MVAKNEIKIKIKNFWKEHKKAIIILFSTWGVYFLLLWPRIISLKPTGLYTGHVNVWSDWALHIGLASIFAYKSPQFWFAYHPMYAGGQLTYPFLTNFISGMLIKLGLSIPLAFIFPSIILTALLLLGMYLLFYLVLRSKVKTILAISLFFLSSGLGFINFIKDFLSNPNLGLFLSPLKDYSPLGDYQWYAGNVVVGLLVPQRPFLLGMTLATWILTGFLYVFLKKEKEERFDKIILIISGILAGILPIVHPHTFIVVVIISGLLSLFLIRKWKSLLYYAIPAGILSTFLYFKFIWGKVENWQHFFVWFPGWTIKEGFVKWSMFWLYIWGAMIPLAIFGWFVLRKKSPVLIQVFFLSFFLIFILGNLFLIQPIPWDNSKLFFWAYFGFSALAASTLSWFWQKKFIGKILVIILTLILVSTGVLELIRLQRIHQNQIQETSADDIRLGLQIRAETDPLAIFLTDTSHNHLVMVWGNRPILLGFTAWVWNFGFSYQQREKDMQTMYQGGLFTEDLLKKYNVSYVAIGPGEIYNMRANENYFSSKFPVAFQNQNYRIYDVRKIWSQ